ncbi:MAG: hypothetical protein HYW23_01485 [Candidatus Aenigmarchaeota archaeon]|nr:hypothetical protein [Candidatus Aenigmarchaeota archaeon]
MPEHIIQPRDLDGYRMTRPLRVEYAHTEGSCFGEYLRYDILHSRALGAIGKTVCDTEHDLLKSLIGTYVSLKGKSCSELTQNEKLMLNKLGELFVHI